MSALAEILANGSFWVAVLRIATPLILGTPIARLMLSAPTSTPATNTAATATPSGCKPASMAMTMPL